MLCIQCMWPSASKLSESSKFEMGEIEIKTKLIYFHKKTLLHGYLFTLT